jgi:hypothetical protein
VGGAFLLLKEKENPPRQALVWWIFPCLFYLSACSFAHHQIGIRRILLLYPLLCLWIGWVVAVLWRQRPFGPVFCVSLSLWYVGSALYTFPNFISYFNEGVGGGSNGARYAVDCNLDWGQGLKALATYLRDKNIRAIYLSYFGGGDPHASDIHYVPIAGVNNVQLIGDPPSVLAEEKRILFVVSATNRVGLYYRNHRIFDWLDSLQPIDKVADALWVYDFTGKPDLVNRMLAVREMRPVWSDHP